MCIRDSAKGAHPWKAEVTEGDATVTAATISNWYKTVYEPTYAAAPEKSTSVSYTHLDVYKRQLLRRP